MKGNISLKEFILGVKRELLEAAEEGSKNPFLQLNQVELEAEFGIETSAAVEGGFSVFVKAKADAGASQSHKVKLVFTPIKGDLGFQYFLPNVTGVPDGTESDTMPPILPTRQGGPYFHVYPRAMPVVDMDAFVQEAVRKALADKDV